MYRPEYPPQGFCCSFSFVLYLILLCLPGRSSSMPFEINWKKSGVFACPCACVDHLPFR